MSVEVGVLPVSLLGAEEGEAGFVGRVGGAQELPNLGLSKRKKGRRGLSGIITDPSLPSIISYCRITDFT